MKTFKHGLIGLTFGALAFASLGQAGPHHDDDRGQSSKHSKARGPLVEALRDATRAYRDVQLAEAAGYVSMGTCVNSGGAEGAMGIHYVKGDEVGDGEVKLAQPEVLMFEERNGRRVLLGAEYIVLADVWDPAHPDGEVPVLMGQHFDYLPAPNRYRLPSAYILHVWAWKDNPNGTFSNWNPKVSCDEYTGETTSQSHSH